LWSLSLPEIWKHRATPSFDVYARNDIVAEQVAGAAEYHLAGLRKWLGMPPATGWEPRCEIRVYATQAELQDATGTGGITYAVSRTDVQNDRILGRRLDAFQRDPWLLSSTLPHELTHLLVADLCRSNEPPLAIDEGIALQTEPPARRLMYARLMSGESPKVSVLLATEEPPADTAAFYAEASAMTTWLLPLLDEQAPTTGRESPIRRLIDTFAGGVNGAWWKAAGFDTGEAAETAWKRWLAEDQRTRRMSLHELTSSRPRVEPRQ
jgi:hypothetical protein